MILTTPGTFHFISRNTGPTVVLRLARRIVRQKIGGTVVQG